MHLRKRILVTGGAGFLGSHLRGRLQKAVQKSSLSLCPKMIPNNDAPKSQQQKSVTDGNRQSP
jgi:nucleoside-diphosphate-sugar epimerase